MSKADETPRTRKRSEDRVEVDTLAEDSLEEVHYILPGMLVEVPRTIVRPLKERKSKWAIYLRVISALSLWWA